ncbi:MAG: 50S ribosome-binding GTPase [Candidatus Nezhaarchaeota archaeon]|nr:50S ribosome-binding GTPase [Candidatus Nezhaarchaeota archaeon]
MVQEQPFREVIDVPTPSQLIDTAFRRSSRISVKVPAKRDKLLVAKLKEEMRVRAVASTITDKLRRIKNSMPMVDSLHPFYRDLFYLVVDVDRFKVALFRTSKASKIVENLYREYRSRIRRVGSTLEAARARREFYGRVASVLRELEGDLKVLSEVKKLRRLPSIDFEVPTIIVSGAPNVGKSSFVKCVSTAQPEVAEYPFTTKRIEVGHVMGQRGILAQVVDTPGLLDRPLEERNNIERQAIVALKNLEGGIAFLIDPTETCGFPLSYQVNVLQSVSETFKDKPMVVALTKMDIASKEHVERALERLEGYRVFLCDTLKCEGTKEVVEELLRKVKKCAGRS